MPRITDINLVELAGQHTLSIRTTTAVDKLPMLIGESYGKIGAYMAGIGALPADAPYVYFHNMDMQNLDVEFVFPAARPLSGQGEIRCGEVPPRKAVTCMYLGAFPDMEPTYAEMAKWIEDHGLVPMNEGYECYYNGPETPENELLTKIVLLLK